MSKNIKVSPKHGVNPSIPTCFWCGNPKKELALMGRMDKKDSKAPKYIVLDYEPCDECKKLFSNGIHVVGCSNEPTAKGQFPMLDSESVKLYPTGAMFVAKEEWVKDFLKANDSEDMIPDVIEKKVLLMPDSIVNEIVSESKKLDNIEDTEEETQNEDN